MSKIAFQGQGGKVRLLCQGLPGWAHRVTSHVLLNPLCPSPKPQTKCSAVQRMLNCLSSRSAPKIEKEKKVLEQWEMEGREGCSLRWLMAPEIRAFEGWKKELEVVSVEKRERGGEGRSRVGGTVPQKGIQTPSLWPQKVLGTLGGSNRKTVWGSVF